MPRKSYRGRGRGSGGKYVGAYYTPVPVHPVDGSGIPSVPGSPLLDSILDTRFLNGSEGNMNDNGSGTPVAYSLAPPADKVWIINSILIYAQNGGMTPNNFLGIGSITNGCLLKVTRGGADRYVIFDEDNPWITTADLLARFPLIPWNNKIGGTGQDYIQVELDPERLFGKKIELDGSQTDRWTFTVRDDLTNIEYLYFQAYGWVEDVAT